MLSFRKVLPELELKLLLQYSRVLVWSWGECINGCWILNNIFMCFCCMPILSWANFPIKCINLPHVELYYKWWWRETFQKLLKRAVKFFIKSGVPPKSSEGSSTWVKQGSEPLCQWAWVRTPGQCSNNLSKRASSVIVKKACKYFLPTAQNYLVIKVVRLFPKWTPENLLSIWMKLTWT